MARVQPSRLLCVNLEHAQVNADLSVPGVYTTTAVPSNMAGAVGFPKSITFTVVAQAAPLPSVPEIHSFELVDAVTGAVLGQLAGPQASTATVNIEEIKYRYGIDSISIQATTNPPVVGGVDMILTGPR